MQNESFAFSAVDPVAISKKRRMRILYTVLFAFAGIMLILSLIDGNKPTIFLFSMLLLSNGFGLFFPIIQKTVTLEMNHSSFRLNNAETHKHLYWKEIKMAQYNGRYLDMYWGSSFLKSIDLQMFPASEQLEILRLAGKYLAQVDVFIANRPDSVLEMA